MKLAGQGDGRDRARVGSLLPLLWLGLAQGFSLSCSAPARLSKVGETIADLAHSATATRYWPP